MDWIALMLSVMKTTFLLLTSILEMSLAAAARAASSACVEETPSETRKWSVVTLSSEQRPSRLDHYSTSRTPIDTNGAICIHVDCV